MDGGETGTAGLDALHARLAPYFARAEPHRHARAYLAGLLSPGVRKTGRQLAARAGERAPDGMQRLLSHAVWDVDGVRDEVRAYVVEYLGDPGGALIVGEAGFPRKGFHSVGVARQYNPTTGRVGHCQVAVFLAYAGPRGCALIDRELYLPAAWLDRAERRAAARIPAAVAPATKAGLAQRMVARALAAGVPAGRVVGDITDDELGLRCQAEECGCADAAGRAGAAEWRPVLEECFAVARGAAGLDRYAVRHWPGWYRHVTLAMLATAYLVVTGVPAPSTSAPSSLAPPRGPA
ncbi:MAG TPA: transposase [Thermomicrobiales bacterium]|nr:transposase [Thermomicrobiales bacterium]